MNVFGFAPRALQRYISGPTSCDTGQRRDSVDSGACALVADDHVEAAGFPVDVADTVGAGDAFAAAFLHGLISNWPAAQIAESSNRVGALVANIHGALPECLPDTIFKV